MNTSQYQTQLDAIIIATKEAGEIARNFQEKGFKQLDDKTKGDPFLTEADLAIDKHLKQELMGKFPSYGWLSEESTPDDDCLEKEFCWIVDPIDGTREFVTGNGEFVVSVGLVRNGLPIAGAIYAPMKEHFIYGAKGTGVFLNGKKVVRPADKPLSESEIIISRSESAAGIWGKHQETLKTRVVGSVAYKIGLVAAGLADITASLKPKNLWDVCAGHMLVEELGYVFKDISGEDIVYKDINKQLTGLVACSSICSLEQLCQQLRQSQ